MKHIGNNTIFTDPDGNLRIATDRDFKRCDETQNRERFSAGALEAVRWLESGVQIIDQATEMGGKTIRKHGCYRLIRCARGLLLRAVRTLENRMTAMQTTRLIEDFEQGKIKIAIGYNAREGCCNVPWSEAQYLAKLAINAHCTTCLCGSKQAEECPLRATLENIPQIVKDDTGFMFCPYQGVKIKEE